MRISITKKDEKYLEIDTLPQDVKRHVVKEAIRNYMQTDAYREILKTFGCTSNNTQSRVTVDKVKVERKNVSNNVQEKSKEVKESKEVKDVEVAIVTEVAIETKPATVIIEKPATEETHTTEKIFTEGSDNFTEDNDTLMNDF